MYKPSRGISRWNLHISQFAIKRMLWYWSCKEFSLEKR